MGKNLSNEEMVKEAVEEAKKAAEAEVEATEEAVETTEEVVEETVDSEESSKEAEETKKDKKDEQIADLTDKLTRQMAEFDNFRKRTENNAFFRAIFY